MLFIPDRSHFVCACAAAAPPHSKNVMSKAWGTHRRIALSRMECRIEFARVDAVIISSSGVFSEGALASPIDFWQLWAGWHQTDVAIPSPSMYRAWSIEPLLLERVNQAGDNEHDGCRWQLGI